MVGTFQEILKNYDADLVYNVEDGCIFYTAVLKPVNNESFNELEMR